MGLIDENIATVYQRPDDMPVVPFENPVYSTAGTPCAQVDIVVTTNSRGAGGMAFCLRRRRRLGNFHIRTARRFLSCAWKWRASTVPYTNWYRGSETLLFRQLHTRTEV